MDRFMQVEKMIGSLRVRYEITDKLNVFEAKSGTGKSFFFKILADDAGTSGIPCILFNHAVMNYTLDALKKLMIGKEIIIFDAVDLYLTQDLLDFALSQNAMVLMSMKHYEGKISLCNATMLRVNYTGNLLEVLKA